MEKEQSIDLRVKSLHVKALQLVEERYMDEHILEALCNEGLSIDYARAILVNAHSDWALKREARSKLTTGLALIIGGMAYNITSYRFAQETGMGMFLLEWGIIIAGMMMLIKSYSLFKRLALSVTCSFPRINSTTDLLQSL